MYEMAGQRGKREPPERMKTPLCTRLSDEGKKRRIELKPLPLLPLAEFPTRIEDDLPIVANALTSRDHSVVQSVLSRKAVARPCKPVSSKGPHLISFGRRLLARN